LPPGGSTHFYAARLWPLGSPRPLGVAGVGLQWKLGQKQLERDRAEVRIQRVADVLGRITPLLADLRPEGIVWTTPYIVLSFHKDPWTPLRGDLGALIASEAAGDLREDLRRLQAGIETLFVSLMRLVSPEHRQRAVEAGDTRNVFETAEEVHAQVEGLLRKILDELHGSAEGAPVGAPSARWGPPWPPGPA